MQLYMFNETEIESLGMVPQRLCEDGGRDWSDKATSPRTPAEQPEARRSKEQIVS